MNRIKIILYKFFRLFLINRKSVLLFSYYGANYGGSPKYIGEYIANNDSKIKIICALTNTKGLRNMPKSIKVVKYNSIIYFYYLATSKVIITNYRMTFEFQKRKEQLYIQTWHSSLRLKMIEKDAEDTLPSNYIEMAKKDSNQIDMLLVGSEKSKEIYEKSFWYKGPFLKCGTPQCDLFFKEDKDLYTRVKESLNIPVETNILLYAPTFRKDGNLEVYDLNFDEIYEGLLKRQDGKWKILIRLHPHLVNKVTEYNHSKNVIDVTTYDDIQELLYISNMIITDYSALMFDFALTCKPCFLYVSDIDQYTANDRKLYFDIEKLPFVVCRDKEKLKKEIIDIDETIYKEKVANFLKEEINSYDNGSACKQVYEYIKGEMNDEEV